MRARVTALTPSMRNLLRWLLKQPNHAAEAPHRLGITATCTALHKRGLVTTWTHDNGPRWARLTDKGRAVAAQLPAPGLRDLPAPPGDNRRPVSRSTTRPCPGCRSLDGEHTFGATCTLTDPANVDPYDP